MEYDKSYQFTGMMAYDRILVNLDTRGGLQEFITIQWRDTSRKKIIDYEGITYRCRRCHKVGHLYRDCPLLHKNRGAEQSLGVAKLNRDPSQGDEHTVPDTIEGDAEALQSISAKETPDKQPCYLTLTSTSC